MGTGPGVSGSEDCLFADVYAPSSAKGSSKLPVYVFIQGGGFNGDGSHMNASSLIPASGMNMVVVSFTYRGGPLGFLASTQVQKSGSLNNGLKDQRRLLQWVQLHIASVSCCLCFPDMTSLIDVLVRWRSRACHTRRPECRRRFSNAAPRCLWRPKR